MQRIEFVGAILLAASLPVVCLAAVIGFAVAGNWLASASMVPSTVFALYGFVPLVQLLWDDLD